MENKKKFRVLGTFMNIASLVNSGGIFREKKFKNSGKISGIFRNSGPEFRLLGIPDISI
jgi:hypothetical protein